MNLETLEEYLQELKWLKDQLFNRNPDKAEDIHTKVLDALKELKLYDAQSVSIQFLNFKKRYHSEEDPYFDSIKKTISHLESRIEIYKHRIQIHIQKQNQQTTEQLNQRDDTLSKLEDRVKRLHEALQLKDNDLKHKTQELTEKQIVIDNLNDKIANAPKFLFLRSLGVWSLIIGSFIAISAWVYEVGKDNATKHDDTEKAVMRSEISSLKAKIDSLEKLVPQVSPVD